MIERTVETYGRLDAAYNNAGFEGQQAAPVDSTEENWKQVVAGNLKSVWLCMRRDRNTYFSYRNLSCSEDA
jgi:NAD(P)-dependent dehydrogenase (short-subunit alcohol dehydrogenase family)